MHLSRILQEEVIIDLRNHETNGSDAAVTAEMVTYLEMCRNLFELGFLMKKQMAQERQTPMDDNCNGYARRLAEAATFLARFPSKFSHQKTIFCLADKTCLEFVFLSICTMTC